MPRTMRLPDRCASCITNWVPTRRGAIRSALPCEPVIRMRRVQPGPRSGAAQHGDLVPQHEQLRVLGLPVQADMVSGFGRVTWRRSIVTSWRSIMISAFLDAWLRPRAQQQPAEDPDHDQVEEAKRQKPRSCPNVSSGQTAVHTPVPSSEAAPETPAAGCHECGSRRRRGRAPRSRPGGVRRPLAGQPRHRAPYRRRAMDRRHADRNYPVGLGNAIRMVSCVSAAAWGR